jgi:hypothetical protein
VLKKKDTGKEWSSDYTGDGPARTKRVSRNTPLEVRRAKKKALQKQRSLSHHQPPLYACCPECDRFLRWKSAANDWMKCDCFLPYCYQCKRTICVACYECDSRANFDERLDHWWCPHCEGRRSRRKRTKTDRYQPNL